MRKTVDGFYLQSVKFLQKIFSMIFTVYNMSWKASKIIEYNEFFTNKREKKMKIK